MPRRPRSPIFGQRSRGNSSVRSISAARGAISDCAKLLTVSRIMSAVSPRSKSREREFESMGTPYPPPPGLPACPEVKGSKVAFEAARHDEIGAHNRQHAADRQNGGGAGGDSRILDGVDKADRKAQQRKDQDSDPGRNVSEPAIEETEILGPMIHLFRIAFAAGEHDRRILSRIESLCVVDKRPI